VESIAKVLINNKRCDVFRAGIWKPRTSPGSFEGIGEEGLKWLRDIQNNYKTQVATEVALPSHVELCLKYNVKFLWIGARTTTSPFAVQEIANSLRGVEGVTVFIKNPINAELKLWIGAFERFLKQGQSKLGGIHRGFSGIENNIFRNLPLWQMAIDLKQKLPDFPVVCDPSHICGKRETLFSVAQQALDFNLDGLMMEVHNDPDNALSDPAQQLTPENFVKLIDSLNSAEVSSDESSKNEEIEYLRAKIDRLDSELISILKERFNVVDGIGKIKQSEKLNIFQPKRFDELIQDRLVLAKKANVSEDFIEDLFRKIHFEALKIQGNQSSKKECA
jgi:chorismate mutase